MPEHDKAEGGEAQAIVEDVAEIVAPLAEKLARTGFDNMVAQLVLKLTTPGIPDFYQGTELFDLSLVDPDNRRPVDFHHRNAHLDDLDELLRRPDPDRVAALLAERSEMAKLYLTTRLLRFRRDHPTVFTGGYRPLEAEGEAADHLIAFARHTADEDIEPDPDRAAELVVLVTRFPVALAERGGWGDTTLVLPDECRGGGWREVLSGIELTADDEIRPETLPLPVAVLWR
jgi:(1->4)-alpha-D-glucan 1-alpha-D-glucosylmutase